MFSEVMKGTLTFHRVSLKKHHIACAERTAHGIHAQSQKFSREQYDNVWEVLLFMSCVDIDGGFMFLTVYALSAKKYYN